MDTIINYPKALIVVLLSSLLFAACSPGEAEQTEADRESNGTESPTVIIVGGHADHDFDRWFNQEDTSILRNAGAQVSYTDDPDAIAGQLNQLDILFLSNNQPLPDPELQESIHDFVRQGNSLLLVHAAIWYNWQEEWPEYYRDFTGGGSHSHPPFGEFDVYLTDELHPVTEGLPERFTVTDELYRFQRADGGTDMNILAYGIEAETGEEYPVIWTTRYGDGKIVNITLGHDGQTHQSPLYITLLENSIQWLSEE